LQLPVNAISDAISDKDSSLNRSDQWLWWYPLVDHLYLRRVYLRRTL